MTKAIKARLSLSAGGPNRAAACGRRDEPFRLQHRQRRRPGCVQRRHCDHQHSVDRPAEDVTFTCPRACTGISTRRPRTAAGLQKRRKQPRHRATRQATVCVAALQIGRAPGSRPPDARSLPASCAARRHRAPWECRARYKAAHRNRSACPSRADLAHPAPPPPPRSAPRPASPAPAPPPSAAPPGSARLRP